MKLFYWHVMDSGKDSVDLLRRLLDRFGTGLQLRAGAQPGARHRLLRARAVGRAVAGDRHGRERRLGQAAARAARSRRSTPRAAASGRPRASDKDATGLGLMDRQRVKMWLRDVYRRNRRSRRLIAAPAMTLRRGASSRGAAAAAALPWFVRGAARRRRRPLRARHRLRPAARRRHGALDPPHRRRPGPSARRCAGSSRPTRRSSASSPAARRSAEAAWAHSVHAEPAGLEPGALVLVSLQRARRARARSAARAPRPPPMPTATLRFAIASCQRYDVGHYAAWRHVAAETSTSCCSSATTSTSTATRHDRGAPPRRRRWSTRSHQYRARYATLQERPVAAGGARGGARGCMVWDDHEVANDYANLQGQDLRARLRARAAPPPTGLLGAHAVSEVGAAARRRHAHRRPLDWGALARIHLPSTTASTATPRSARSPDRGGSNTVALARLPGAARPGAHACSAPSRSAGSPTAGTSRRPLEPARAADADGALRLGATTRESAAGVYWTDGWDGYAPARNRLLGAVASNARCPDVVVLGGDVHGNYVADLKADYDDPSSPVVASEFCGTSITSLSLAQSRIDAARAVQPAHPLRPRRPARLHELRARREAAARAAAGGRPAARSGERDHAPRRASSSTPPGRGRAPPDGVPGAPFAKRAGAATTSTKPDRARRIATPRAPAPLVDSHEAAMLKIASALLLSVLAGSAGAQTFLTATLNNRARTRRRSRRRQAVQPRPASFGTANFFIDSAATFMTFTATIFNIDVTGSQTADVNDNLVAAHIHAGPLVSPTVNGPVVWGFFGTPFNDNAPNDFVVHAVRHRRRRHVQRQVGPGGRQRTTLDGAAPNILDRPRLHQLPHHPVRRRRDPRQHRRGPRARDLRPDARRPGDRRRRRAAPRSRRARALVDLTGKHRGRPTTNRPKAGVRTGRPCRPRRAPASTARSSAR